MIKKINWNLLKPNKELEYGLEIMKIINDLGYESLIVGGYVRNILLNKNPNDVDISTNCPQEKIEKLFNTLEVGKSFGVTIVKYKGFIFEVSQYRSDIYNNFDKGKGANTVKFVSTFKEDSKRRDFTINSLGVDYNGNIYDYHNGREDIKNKIIRTVGNPYIRFKEDYLRLIRAIRFSSILEMTIHSDTYIAIENNASNILNVSNERITAEIFKMANQSGKRFALSINLLKEIGLLDYIMPEISVMDSFEHSKEHHPEGNVLVHTLRALEENYNGGVLQNLCILYHDIGKTVTYNYVDEKITYHQHDRKGIKLIEGIAKRDKWDNTTKDAVQFCALNHMKVHYILNMKKNKIIKLMNSPYWKLLLCTSYTDEKCRMYLFDEKLWNKKMEKINSINKKYSNQENDALTSIKNIVNGKLVMKIKEFTEPSKRIGDIIQQTITWITDNDINLEDTKKIEQYIKSL